MFDYDFNLTINSNIHSYNTTNKSNVRKPKAKRCWRQWTVVSRASDDWNGMEMAIGCLGNLMIFKEL